MIKHFPFQQLGKANHGWLQSSHHFSFAHYYHPNRMGFGTLKVVNDDRVVAGKGFPAHPHRNMEIISVIRSGAITHKDSAGNEAVTVSGEVQVMSAGSGIVHSEYNLTKEPLTFYQIWIEPNKRNVVPRWESKLFPVQVNDNELPLLVSGYQQDVERALFIHQKARIFGGLLAQGAEFEHKINHQAYILASKGVFKIIDNGQTVIMKKGDGATVIKQNNIKIQATTACELILIDAPEN